MTPSDSRPDYGGEPITNARMMRPAPNPFLEGRLMRIRQAADRVKRGGRGKTAALRELLDLATANVPADFLALQVRTD